MMRHLHFLPPIAALALSGAWLGMQQHSISTVEGDTILLRDHIRAAHERLASGDGSPARLRADGGKGKARNEGIDWKGLAETMAKAGRGGLPDMQELMKIQRKVMSFNAAELTAALDEIAALELSKDSRRSLEDILITALSQKEPELVLSRFIGRLEEADSSGSWQLANAFRQWTDKDGAAAAAWLDSQIAAGKFESKSLDGKSQSRMQFEASVISSLLRSDPSAAGSRLSTIPEEMRKDMFQQGLLADARPGEEKNYVELVRQSLPEGERSRAFDRLTNSLVQRGGYDKVGEFLDEIDASPGERKSIVTQAVSNKIQQLSFRSGVERKDVDEMRAWVRKESPESVDTITGESLGGAWGDESKWLGNAKIVSDLHAENPSDELLMSFLKSHQASKHPEAAREMAAKITDETKRAELMDRFKAVPVPGK